MKLTLTINLDNDAFQPPEPEVSRLLRKLAGKLDDQTVVLEDGIDFPVVDYNGNRCGAVEVEDD